MSEFDDVLAGRGITEILHFSTNLGLAGILGEGAVLSRKRLPETEYVEHVYKPNAEVRRDGDWLDYVNLSISRLNTTFFGHSSRWHRHKRVWWCALSFDPVMLGHEGVKFATTNNMYSGCRRRAGAVGLEALFAERIECWRGKVIDRAADLPAAYTTDLQAEVLYPERVDCRYLRRIYVATGPHQDIVTANCEILLDPTRTGRNVPVVIDPDIFHG